MELGLALLERIEGDTVLSPYSLQRALDLVRNGATGRTLEALDAMLGEPAPDVPDAIHAQAAWLGDGYEPGPALQGLQTGPLDADLVNAWVKKATREMIPRLVDRFYGDEILALTDAIYLDAKWAHPFTGTNQKPFDGVGDVPMMYVNGRFDHTGTAVRLPYTNDLRFVAELGTTLNLDTSFSHDHGHVELPRFSTTATHELEEPLKQLGLAPAFEPGLDLENLVHGPGKKALSRVLQRARVDVDEAGTRAAAATAVTMQRTSAPLDPFHIVFDRPFTWAIEHAPTGTLLFVGRVLNPTERSD